MLADLSIVPVGHGPHTSEVLAGVLKIIKESGLPYQLTPTSTCIEGAWGELMSVVQRCHEAARWHAPHVVTLLRIEDDGETGPKLRVNLESVEKQVGEPLATSPATAGRGGETAKASSEPAPSVATA